MLMMMLVTLMLLAVSVLSLIANLIHVHLVAEVQVGHVGRHHWMPLEVWHPLERYDHEKRNHNPVQNMRSASFVSCWLATGVLSDANC